MRLTCPSCGARYDVDDAMIPPEGRDVECSNCATTWFQPGANGPGAVATAQPRPPVSDDEGDGPAEVPAPPRRKLDPAVRDILMQEAAREARLRQGVAPQDPTPPAVPAIRAEPGLPATVDTAPATEPRDADLPDTAEIGATLRAGGDREAAEATTSDIDTLDAAPRRRSGVRLGFFGVLVLAGIGAVLYAYAGAVAEAIPALAGPLDGFVATVDAARILVHDTLTGLAEG